MLYASVVNTLQFHRLAEFIQSKMTQKGLDYREVARRSRGGISHSGVHQIATKRVNDVSIGTLQAIARGLDVPEDLLFDVARGIERNDLTEQEQQLLKYFREMDRIGRSAILKVAESLPKANN